jgi:hypothetical protein
MHTHTTPDTLITGGNRMHILKVLKIDTDAKKLPYALLLRSSKHVTHVAVEGVEINSIKMTMGIRQHGNAWLREIRKGMLHGMGWTISL